MIDPENAPGQCTKFELRANFSGSFEGQGTAGGADEEESVVPGHAVFLARTPDTRRRKDLLTASQEDTIES